MVPALIQAGWFSKGEASHLSVATLLGYVFGAWASNFLASRLRAVTLLRTAMLVCSLSFFAGAIEGAGITWHYLWRVVAGFCGAVLMVLPAPVVLPRHGPGIRGRVSGVVFSGIGLGAVLSGLLVPVLVAGVGLVLVVSNTHLPVFDIRGPVGAWLGMGAMCLGLTLLAWRQWPAEAHIRADSTPAPGPAAAIAPASLGAVRLIWAAHALNAIGYLAHTLFWVDYLVRELGLPLATGGFLWSVFGLGAAVGPLLTGALADAFGLKRCLIVAFLLKALSAALPLMSNDFSTLFVSSLLMGIFTPGIAALISAYTLDRVGAEHHRKAWGTATFSFAIAQAAGGFLMALAATHLDSYRPLFVVSAAALFGSVVCIAAIKAKPRDEPSTPGPVRPLNPRQSPSNFCVDASGDDMKHHPFRTFAIAISTAFTLHLLAAAPAHAQIRIGQTSGFTGPVAAAVAEINTGAKLYLDSVNDEGGVGGQKIELISLDDKNQVPLAAENAKQLIADSRTVALFLTRGTPHAQAMLPLLAEGQVVLLAPSTGAMVLHKPVNPWVFNVRAPYQVEAERVVRHLGLAGLEKVALCAVDDSFGTDALEGALRVFKEANKVPMVNQAIDKFKPDYTACVQKSLAANALGVLIVGTPVSVAAGVNAFRASGSQATVATLSNNASSGFIKELGKNAEGVIVSQVFPSERSLATPMIAEAARLASGKKIQQLTPAMIEGFAAAKVLVAGLRRAADANKGVVTRSGLKRALETFNRVDIGGGLGGRELSYSATDHTGLDYVDLSRINADGLFRR